MSRWDWGRNSYRDWIEASEALEAAGWRDSKSLALRQQLFWKCKHHRIALQNFFEGRTRCEWECDTQPLLWHQNGEYPEPKCKQKPFVPYNIGV